MMGVILYIIGEIFHGIALALPLIGYLPARRNKYKSFIGIILILLAGYPFVVILFAGSSNLFLGIESSQIVNILKAATAFFFLFLSITLYFFAVYLNFKCAFKKRVFITLFLVIAESLAAKSVSIIIGHFYPRDDNIASYNILDIARNTSMVDFIESVLISLVLLIVLTISFRFFIRGKLSFGIKRIIFTIIFFLVQFFSIGLVSELFRENPNYTLIGKIMFISVPVAFIALYIMYIWKNSKNELLESEKNYISYINNVQSQYINEIIKQSEQITKLKHDFNTHAGIIADLTEREKYNELKSYLKEYISEYKLEPLHFCTRTSLNAVLLNKYRIAMDMHIKVQIFFDDKDIGQISDIDLCSVVSNLLQNAIDACQRLQSPDTERTIKLSAGSKADCFVITQENTSAEPNIGFMTTKPDKNNHGIGFGIISDIAKKYNGSVKHEYSGGFFKSTVLLGI